MAFGTTDDIAAGIEYLREQGMKEVNVRFGRFESRMFNCTVKSTRLTTSSWSIGEVECPCDTDIGCPRKM